MTGDKYIKKNYELYENYKTNNPYVAHSKIIHLDIIKLMEKFSKHFIISYIMTILELIINISLAIYNNNIIYPIILLVLIIIMHKILSISPSMNIAADDTLRNYIEIITLSMTEVADMNFEKFQNIIHDLHELKSKLKVYVDNIKNLYFVINILFIIFTILIFI